MTDQRLDRNLMAPHNGWGAAQSLVPLAAYTILLWAAATLQGPVLALVAGLIGLVQYRLYFPLHEAAHNSLFTRPWANRAMGQFLAGLLFTSYEAFRQEHWVHHGSFGSAKDPGRVDYDVRFSGRRELAIFLLAPLMGGTVLIKLRNLVSFSDPRRNARALQARSEMLFMLLLQSGLFFGLQGPFDAPWRYPVLVVLPFATIFLFLSRLRMFLEHAPLDNSASLLSRSVTGRDIFSSLLSGCNFRYHNDHHRYPQIPGVHLPHIRALRGVPAEAREVTVSYLSPLRSHWRNLR